MKHRREQSAAALRLRRGFLAAVAVLACAAGPACAAGNPRGDMGDRGGEARAIQPGQAWMGAGIQRHEGPRAPDLELRRKPGSATGRAISGTPGVDVSSWQGDVDWAQLWKDKIRFAYAKATEGAHYTNPEFAGQYNGSAKVGMRRGAYHFAIPSDSSGAAQADYFLQHGGGWSADGKTLPGALDIEYNPSSKGNSCYDLSKSQMADWIADFATTYRKRTGRDAVIYTSTNWWNQCVADKTGSGEPVAADSPLWVANWGSSAGKLPQGWSTHTFWQYTNAGSVVGDHDSFNGTEAELASFAKSGPRPSPVPMRNSLPYDAKLWRSARHMATGDFTGNGTDDLLVVWVDGEVSLYPGVRSGGWGAERRIAAPGSVWKHATAIAGGDFTGSGHAGLGVVWSDGEATLYSGDGHGGLGTEHQIGKPGSVWKHATAIAGGDFTGSGHAGLGVAWSDGEATAYSGDGRGGLGTEHQIATPGSVWKHARHLTSGHFGPGPQTDLGVVWSDGEATIYSGFGKHGQGQEHQVARPHSAWQQTRSLAAGRFAGADVSGLVALWPTGGVSLFPGDGKAGVGGEVHMVKGA